MLLNYYRVDEGLWQNRESRFQLSSFALDAARKERYQRHQRNRLKDLPNLTFQIASCLWRRALPMKRRYCSGGEDELAENAL